KGWDARKRAYCLKIQPATGSFARNLIYSTKPFCTHGITDQDRLDTLSTQEMKVFRYILSGVDYTTIGSKMNISNKTVSTYKVRLMDKLGCSTLLELYDFAQRNKIG
ncbi:LuxR C-terminal-related transcriptional regulator, partial [Klebsiella pneumoniae]